MLCISEVRNFVLYFTESYYKAALPFRVLYCQALTLKLLVLLLYVTDVDFFGQLLLNVCVGLVGSLIGGLKFC